MSTLLLLFAFIAIALGGIDGWSRIVDDRRGGDLVLWTVMASPYFVPAIFAAHALGRKTLTASLIVSFALAEFGALGIAYSVYTMRLWAAYF